MKSVFRTTTSAANGQDVTQQAVLVQPAVDGTPLMVLALNAAIAAAGPGAIGMSADAVGDVGLDVTAGGTGEATLYAAHVRQASGQIVMTFVLSNAIASPATPAITHAINALIEANGPTCSVQAINKLALIDIDATA